MNSKCPSCNVNLRKAYLKLDRVERFYSKTTPIYKCHKCSSELVKNISKANQDTVWAVLTITSISTVLIVVVLWYLFSESNLRSLIVPIPIITLIISKAMIRKLDKTPHDWPEWKLK